jgi:DNA-directed RNA polymerase-5 subunit 1
MLKELIKYHVKVDEKMADFDHFTVDIHPLYKDTRCFFVVTKNGEKRDFSFTKCLVNLDEKRKEEHLAK